MAQATTPYAPPAGEPVYGDVYPHASNDHDKTLEDLKRQVVGAMDLLEDGRLETEIDDDYYHDNQWTPEERRILNARRQPAITFNQVKTGINAIIGIIEQSKTDPKAWGRTPKDQPKAEVATDSLRYIADSNNFQSIISATAKDFLVRGICASIIEVDDSIERNVIVRKIRPEEYFYDPYSREFDFSDARYDGIAKWMDEEDVIALYPDKAKQISNSIEMAVSPNVTFDDRPQRAWTWADRKHRRVMVFEMYKRYAAEWYKCVFISGCILESGYSPYKDGRGKSKKAIISQSAYVNRENTRYGAVRTMRGPQDAINKTRSKAVHLLNVNKLRVDPGVSDVDLIRAEYAKPDGIIEAREGQITELKGKEFVQAHLELMRDAKAEMAYLSPSPGIVGRQNVNQSGKAILAEQKAGLIEQTPLISRFTDWQLRNYRGMWEAAKQFWRAPKYIRITDDEQAPKFIMMNEPSLVIDPMTNQPMAGPTGQPLVNPNIPLRNSIEDMDMDIIIDVSPDTAALQEEQFAKLAEMAQAGVPVPPELIIEASSLPKKRVLLDRIQTMKDEAKNNPPPNPEAMKVEAEKAKSDIKLKVSEAESQLKMKELGLQNELDDKKHQRQMALEDKKVDAARRVAKAARREAKANGKSEGTEPKMAEPNNAPLSQEPMEDDDPEIIAAKAQIRSAQTLEKAAEALMMSAQAMMSVSQSMAEMVRVSSLPKRLIKDQVTGEKRVETIQ